MERWPLDTPVQVMARVLGASRRGFYAWRVRSLCERAQEDERLKIALQAAPIKTRQIDGVRRLQSELEAEGFEVGRDRIARLRREIGIGGKQKRQFKATTRSNHDLPVAENRLEPQFEAQAPNEVWPADITSILTGEGWLYLAGVKDQFTGEIVGYARGERMTQALVGQALEAVMNYAARAATAL